MGIRRVTNSSDLFSLSCLLLFCLLDFFYYVSCFKWQKKKKKIIFSYDFSSSQCLSVARLGDRACGKFLSLLKLIKLNLSAVLQLFPYDQKLLQNACLGIIF